MIVPELAAGAAAEFDELRAACDAALARLADSRARTLVVIGVDEREHEYTFPFRGSLRPWGLPLDVHLGPPSAGPPTEPLPLSLTIGAWLVGRGFTPAQPVTYRMATVRRDAAPADCAEFGRQLDADEPWALLVMGDGSACRGEKSPGYDDPRAQPYDDGVAAALACADAAALRDLDLRLSAELMVAGRAPWQVLAGAAEAAGGEWRGALSYHAAPYGVAYFVASWSRIPESARSELASPAVANGRQAQ
ncbi:hypothetical protein [Micromonospora sp. NPDC049679]|uniref:hypothetical protein n=1 Tax=Micromonospora sp. NPDC049679 TaxID=3155920 RepID=UPI0033DB113A